MLTKLVPPALARTLNAMASCMSEERECSTVKVFSSSRSVRAGST